MDRSLVEQAQRGDRDAYEALAHGSARRLYLAAYRIVRDADQAEDAVQQTLVAMWQELPSLRDPDRFESWTYRLVVRFCLAEARRHRRAGIRQIPIDELLPSRGDDFAESDLRDQLTRALEGLSLDHRTVVVLHHYAGLPLAEIAEILGIPFGTVGSRLHHATRALRASLAAGERTTATGGHPA
ncbi:MAG: sigma-70 family RNA polymerase sigma factor [Candidatus Limnocylindrales bacterium]